MRIAIVGGGLTGLIAGYQLSSVFKITIFEKDKEIGGLLSSYHRPEYSIERYYHHFFSGDKHLLRISEDLGLTDDIVWLQGSTGTYINGRIVPLTTPFEIIRYPYLSVTDKVKLALFTISARKLQFEDLDDISAVDFINERLGEKIYESFFRPLLISKFGQNAGSISAAWLVSRVAIRSDRSAGGERLGYFKKGFSGFIAGLSSAIESSGGSIRCMEPVVCLKEVTGGWEVNGEKYDMVISTIAPVLMKGMGISLPDIPYQGAACLTLAMSRQVTGGIYWINLYDDAPYGAVIGHTCFAPYDWYHEHIVYLASYFTGEVNPDLKNIMIQDFCKKFSVNPDEIKWAELAVDQYAGPLYITGYKKLMNKDKGSDIFLAGMHSLENYPERSIEGCICAGIRVAEEVNSAAISGKVMA